MVAAAAAAVATTATKDPGHGFLELSLDHAYPENNYFPITMITNGRIPIFTSIIANCNSRLTLFASKYDAMVPSLPVSHHIDVINDVLEETGIFQVAKVTGVVGEG